jgi:hypothetical protein
MPGHRRPVLGHINHRAGIACALQGDQEMLPLIAANIAGAVLPDLANAATKMLGIGSEPKLPTSADDII